MDDFDWMEEQVGYIDAYTEHIIKMCKRFGYVTIQEYVNKLKEIRSRHMVKIGRWKSKKQDSKYTLMYEKRVKNIDSNIRLMNLMVDNGVKVWGN